ncbi:MAG: hypothetical protein M9962_05155 [Oligoflexia bacterium]|nr:hypothetical protein [Oligoflexia bacterium]
MSLNFLSVFFIALFFNHQAFALSLDWSGYFRADHNFVHNYQMDKSSPGYSNSGNTGEYIQGQGKKSTTFSSMFLKLNPKVLINDNVIVHSEWNVGDPIAGFFGRGIPREDRNNAFSTRKDSMELSVARLWLDVHTDFGTFQVGRAPFHWGLGVIFNSGDRPFDRFQSTSDTIRLVSKFGYLSLTPIYAKNSVGRNLAGARNPITDTILQGSDDVTDYGLALRYDNPEEDLDAGFLFYKRNASDAQNAYYYPNTATTYTGGANGMNLKLMNFFAKKSWKKFELGVEVPLFSGDIGDINQVGQRNEFKATAVAVESAVKFETWKHSLKFGTVPGQNAATTGSRGKSFGALQLHRAYKLGMILFNYNLGNFGPANPDTVPGNANALNTTVSPYDSAITNAKYLMFSSEKTWEQWGLHFGLVWAKANQTAETGKDMFNHRTRQWFTSVAKQDSNMGIEVDLGTRYNWDDNISFGADIGMLMPGNYFKYINSATSEGPANNVTAFSLSASTVF